VRGAPAVELEAFVDDPADPLVALNGRFLQRPVASFGERVTAWSWKKCLRIMMLKHPGIKMSPCPAAFSGSGEADEAFRSVMGGTDAIVPRNHLAHR
jgi:hypothetical protein